MASARCPLLVSYRDSGERGRAEEELEDVLAVAREARERKRRIAIVVASGIAGAFGIAALVGARMRTLVLADERCHSVTVIVERRDSVSEPRTSRVCRTVHKSDPGHFF